MRPSLLFVILSTVCMLGIEGCQTTSEKPSTTGTKQSQRDDPFLLRGDYPEELGLLIQKVFASHSFLRPWIVVRAFDASIWFVVEREVAPLRFDRLHVRINRKREVSASITAYQFVGSDWAMLGPLARNFDPEAESRNVAVEISKRLKESNIEVR